MGQPTFMGIPIRSVESLDMPDDLVLLVGPPTDDPDLNRVRAWILAHASNVIEQE